MNMNKVTTGHKQTHNGTGSERLARVRTVAQNLNRQIDHQMKERPWAMMAGAATTGFLAGSILGSRIAQLAVAAAAGYLGRDLIERSGVADDLRRALRGALDTATEAR